MKSQRAMTVMSQRTMMSSSYEPTEVEIEAAARAWLDWQFPGRYWNTATQAMKDKFREGAKVVLQAAGNARTINE